MRTLVVMAAVCLAVLGVRLSGIEFPDIDLAPAARAQAVPKSLEQGGIESSLKDRKNSWTVGVPAGSCRAPT